MNRQNYKIQAKLIDFFIPNFLKTLVWHKVYNMAPEATCQVTYGRVANSGPRASNIAPRGKSFC